VTLTDEGAGWWLVASTGEQRIRANPIRASGPLARRPAARAGRVGDCIPAPSEGCPSRPGRWCPRWCTPSSNRPPPPRSGPGSGAAPQTVHRCRQPLVGPAEDIPAFAPFRKSTGPDLAEQPGGASQHRDSPAHRRGRYLPDSGLQWCVSSARWAPTRRRAGGRWSLPGGGVDGGRQRHSIDRATLPTVRSRSGAPTPRVTLRPPRRGGDLSLLLRAGFPRPGRPRPSYRRRRCRRRARRHRDRA